MIILKRSLVALIILLGIIFIPLVSLYAIFGWIFTGIDGADLIFGPVERLISWSNK